MTGAALFSLVPAEPSFEIGEQVVLSIQVDNRGTESVSGSVLAVFKGRDDLFVSVIDPHGQPCGDPWRWNPLGMISGDPFESVDVPPGRTGELQIDLTRHAWMDIPGTYHVRLLAPFQRERREPPPESDPRWVEANVVLVAPRDTSEVISSHPQGFDIWNAFDDGIQPSNHTLDTYDALGHVMYVPLLEPYEIERSIRGIGACPCTEGTEALLRMYDRTRSAERREMIQEELLLRIPRTHSDPTWFVTQAWNVRLEQDALSRATAALSTSTQIPGWSETYEWGATVIQRIGDASDRELLQQAMERALDGNEDEAEGANGRAEVLQTLSWALREHPGPSVEAAGDAKLVVDLHAWDGRTGDPPPGWESVVVPALLSEDPAILAQAMDRLPWPASRPLVDAIVPHIGSQDGLVSGYLHRYLVRHPPGDMMRGPLFAELATAEPWRVEPLLIELRPYVPLDEWLNLVLVSLSADPSNDDLIDLLNFGFDTKACKERGHHRDDDTNVTVLVAAWMKVLRTLDPPAGPIAIVPGVTDPALVRPSFTCKLASGETWPAR